LKTIPEQNQNPNQAIPEHKAEESFPFSILHSPLEPLTPSAEGRQAEVLNLGLPEAGPEDGAPTAPKPKGVLQLRAESLLGPTRLP